MDCKTAHLLLDFNRPTPAELETSEAEALENHLLDCTACARLARDERRLDDHIGQAMRDVAVPVGLRERLIAGLDPQPVIVRRRRFSRSAWSLAAAAAVLLLALGGAYLATRPRTVDLAQLQENAWAQFNPQREQVDAWLEAGHFRVPAPDQFNYKLLTQYDIARLDSRTVPMLLFTFPSEGRVHQARVYLLDSRQFDLATLRATPPVFESGCVVDFIPHPDDPRFGYLVVHNADRVNNFFDSSMHLTRS
jgi:anti-sigma factor RsiW